MRLPEGDGGREGMVGVRLSFASLDRLVLAQKACSSGLVSRTLNPGTPITEPSTSCGPVVVKTGSSGRSQMCQSWWRRADWAINHLALLHGPFVLIVSAYCCCKELCVFDCHHLFRNVALRVVNLGQSAKDLGYKIGCALSVYNTALLADDECV